MAFVTKIVELVWLLTRCWFLLSSAKNKNPIVANMIFYSVVREIWLLDYNIVKVPVFKCDWIKNDTNVKLDDLGFTIVDLQRLRHEDDPFILAT